MAVTWCVVGLGNPGRRYAGTRHNAGFMVLDSLAADHGARWTARQLYDYCELPDPGLLLVKPATYMNDSGRAVRQFTAYRSIEPARLLVVCDDLNLPLGRLRLRAAGNDGGHNGLKSVIASLGTPAFPRLRLGVDPNPPGVDSADYVLSPFKRSQAAAVAAMVERAARGLEYLAGNGIARAMNQINQNTQ
ncbi:MAG: aminoacyl-tRNA hydrolase [Candidatus Edwardsbacteria bacterium]|jgi:PTH1 family peptidyl-tRNA hydrolase|nr:aminoacyl-tRNA hydrolase [Candidatus Edwardsbacteria bacterium]